MPRCFTCTYAFIALLMGFQFETRSPLDLRPRLSTSQQTQILSDVQQHQQFSFPSSEGSVPTTNSPFSSLARYKVDRKKQNQQQLQQRIQQFPVNNFNQPAPQLPNIPNDFFGADHQQPSQQLQDYYEKQRQLEILQRQREQLLLEQQELRRQQELLRLQQQQLRSTILPPVTTTTSIPTTTASSILLSSPTARRITPSENDIFLRAIATHQKKFTTTQKPPTTKARQERVQDQNDQPAIPKDLLSLIQAQQNQAGKSKPQIKFIYQTEKPPTSSGKASAGGSSDRDLLLKQLKLALSQSGLDDKERNVTTRDIVLPNGKKLQVIHAPNGLPSNSAATTTTIKPPKAIFEELTKGVVPPGADFEVLRQSNDGKLEDLGKNGLQNQPAKKVTFVVLEEQADGSYKVQGVKGNAEKDSGTDVDSIVERIKKGELKLPPSSKHPTTSTSSPVRTQSADSSDISPNTLSTTFRPTVPTTRSSPQVSISPNSVSSTDKYVTSASSVSGHVLNSLGSTTSKPSAVSHVTVKYPSSSTTGFDSNEIRLSSTTPASSFGHSNSFVDFKSSFPPTSKKPVSSTGQNYAVNRESLSNLLRREGLFAMAKYLRQSGLDNVLNETGPYTIFVPTDKAFRTLLVQLGGPEKAEQKFKDNPRLLSGLLLHHVVPGAFKIESLQDEMTGVSLAGTQLRVNVYSMHDHEWNDIKVTTVNGARVAPNKRDVEIPQGLAHAIDRVMFPLPVGDLVQTLQADRERRFSTFLKLLHASGLEDMLSGTKTFTVFAPTDAAFVEAATKNGGTPIWQESDGPEAAKEIVLRHVIPTTLYTAGMRYYHQKETLRQQVPLQIQKTGGRIRVNEGHIITYNVPATNGVLHAVDAVM
ncbi:hypothetical protein TSAR_013032 [Trichomalopsis sarcophagae]|uniref:FAS1 domain-containing protein n=1 Tax=Trichomalopsis sarcophagae TaxID=543379 RepID=A0A232F3X5_9HYME|nr:hypothetical protein TSAR_013032 [Trichomalopsis sarcophagae]